MSDSLKKVLIVDDDVAVTNYFMVFLMQTDLFDPEVENDSRLVAELLKKNTYDVIMLDLDMPNVTGMEILKMMRSENILIPVIILTGASDVDLAVRAMKYGAFDYMTKPVDEEQLLDVLASAVEMGALKQSMEEVPDEVVAEDLDNQSAFEHLPTQDPAMLRLFYKAEALATGDLGVFISGERGSGKKEIARGIHNASDRRDGPFVVLDCTSCTPLAFSGLLFGIGPDWSGEKDEMVGALNEATGGTLFINNIEHMSPQVQLRLNHALHSGEFYRDNSTEILNCDVRFTVASTHDLTSTKFQESFSRDLLYHVMVNNLQIPPLRERSKDIPLLVQFIIDKENRRFNKNIEGINPELMGSLQKYFFPGNMRELRKLITSAARNRQEGILGVEDISSYSRERIALGSFNSTFQPRKLKIVLLEHVGETVKYCKGDLQKAAKLLDVSMKEMSEYLDEK